MPAPSTLIRGGTILDGTGQPSFVSDVRLRGNCIEAIDVDLPVNDSEIVDAAGLFVTPGLIDLHAHVYHGTGIFSVDPTAVGLATGVTTLLDAGSAGSLSYETFSRYVMPAVREEIYALLNISQVGVQGHPQADPVSRDLYEAGHIDVEKAVACIERHPDRILGAKARLTAWLANDRLENEQAAMHGVIEAASRTGRWCMIHHVASAISKRELLEALRPGDIVTHMYQGRGDSGFDATEGMPESAMIAARERGIRFDVGHGIGSFVWRIAEPATQQHGFWPDTISTDIHQFNLHTVVFDMPTTMTKFLYLGMPLEEIVQRSTWEPAKIMGLDGRLGRLKKGLEADVALFHLEAGRHPLTDVEMQVRYGDRKFVPVMAFKSGNRFKA